MKFETYLVSGMNDVIGSPVNLNNNIIGKIIDYNKETGKSIIEIESDDISKKIIDKMMPSL